MYDGFELEPTTKEVAIGVLIVLAVLVGIFCTGYMYGIRNAGTGTGGENLHDNGNGTAAVGSQLTETETAVNNAKNGIEAAAGTADHIGAGIADAKESAGYIQHTADTSAEIIADCQSIIDAVRARGQAGKATH